jgi:drug/metabolite transporter (DMT)-like permease
VIAGLACAFAATVLYGLASVLQAMGARRGGSTEGIARLMTQGPYLAGLAMDGAGFVISLLAFRTLPLFVVEAVLASSVGITAIGAARLLHQQLARREVLTIVVLIVGLAMLALSARSEHPIAVARLWQWVVLGSAVVIAVAAFAITARPARSGAGGALALAACAGLAFGGLAVATRVLEVPDPLWRVVGSPALYAMAVFGGTGIVVFAVALQRGSVTAVTAVTFAAETLAPAAVGLLWLGDGTRPGFAIVAAAGFVLALGAAIGLSRYGEIAVPEPADQR